MDLFAFGITFCVPRIYKRDFKPNANKTRLFLSHYFLHNFSFIFYNARNGTLYAYVKECSGKIPLEAIIVQKFLATLQSIATMSLLIYD